MDVVEWTRIKTSFHNDGLVIIVIKNGLNVAPFAHGRCALEGYQSPQEKNKEQIVYRQYV